MEHEAELTGSHKYMQHETDIAIAGSGLAGLTASVALARLGFRVTNVSPAPTREDRRTTALLAASVELLRRCGVWEDLVSAPAPLEVMRIIDGTGRLIRAPQADFHASEIGLEAFGYNVENSAIEKVLKDACLSRGVHFVEDHVTGLHIREDGVSVETGEGDVVDARLCIGADGRNSSVRRLAGFAERAWSYRQTAIVLNFTCEYPHENTSTEFHTANGPFTIVPLSERLCSLVWVDQPEAARSWIERPRPKLALEVERRMQSMLGKVEIASDVQAWPLSGMVARRFGSGPLVLVGEAAHVFPPIGAQGFNLGIRDIEVLEKLVSGKRANELGNIGIEYHRRRSADIASRGASIDLLNRSLLSSFLPVQAIRSVGLSLLGTVGPLRRLVMREGVSPGGQAKAVFDRLRTG